MCLTALQHAMGEVYNKYGSINVIKQIDCSTEFIEKLKQVFPALRGENTISIALGVPIIEKPKQKNDFKIIIIVRGVKQNDENDRGRGC